jgi:lipid-A-disaccharide synthase
LKSPANSEHPDILLSAGDASSDLYGSLLLHEIWQRFPQARVRGIGGPRLKAAGLELIADSSQWSRISIVDALLIAPVVYLFYVKVKRILHRERPSLFIAMDWGAANVPLTWYARHWGVPSLYYLPPRSWDRAATRFQHLAQSATKIATPFPWSAERLREAGANVAFVGHPVLDSARPTRSRDEMRQSLNVPPDEKLIALLPGSRSLEIKYNMPAFLETARRLRRQNRRLRFAIALAANVNEATIARHVSQRPVEGLQVVKDQTFNLLHACDLALVTSGTATLEAAVLETPMVIAYPAPWFFFAQAAFVKKVPTVIGLPNIIAEEIIVPEVFGKRFSVETLTETMQQLLETPDALNRMRQQLKQVRQTLGTPGATARTADIVTELIQGERSTTILHHAT